ncbi:type II toxin-antitoxin system PemK/MazF family toxin [Francisella sp. 19X1-34]|uniref:type II toxin-antitoxin system PemK/MazF family toxin n=1 Tax=Francisella sp. 19X1-34 TaxID=3087177 RepID=UPI002E2FE347|nr:type II toxin-antitoxin system PemK/MazF family toxin [Francisella sp. 19X1-34]MED7789647.1 type II toxin-antitoxin system PemK/MazF family toxin [Francisella sp. 19X1-34]
MSYNFGDIVLVNFPFTNLKKTKKRPAVIISSEEYNNNRPDVILMAITSQIRTPLDFGSSYIVKWQESGLPKPSLLKPLIATIEQEYIDKKLGSLVYADKENLLCNIHDLLGE